MSVPSQPTHISWLQVAFSMIMPVVVAVWAAPGTMIFGERYGWNEVPFALVAWCVVLFVAGAWLRQALLNRMQTFLPYLAAIVLILAIWGWQRQAFIALVPSANLRYGYFLRPEGVRARLWTLTFPFWVGITCLSGCFLAALLSGWRAGARRSLACIIPWWLAAALVFSLPSMYLDGQGNASIFI